MSQCYSGSFANVIYDTQRVDEPDGNVCGYFASTAARPAYGCYPENQGRENVGYSFRFIEAMRSTPRLREAHARVLVADQTPDVPNRTSDHYLQSVLENAAQLRGIPVHELVDDLLELAWERADSWEEVELLEEVSEAFGTLQARSIPDLDREKSRLAEFLDLKRENFGRFLRQHPDWRALLEPEVLDSLAPEDRRGLRHDLLDALATLTAADVAMQIRLETMRDRHALADGARYRMEVRRATVDRLRSLLTRIAGRVHLEVSANPDQQSAFDGLNSCEALALDESVAPLRSRLLEPEPFPLLADDIRLAQEVVPGWIGITYSRAPVSPSAPLPSAAGAVVVQSVSPRSPAERAGVRVGDVILGPPNAHFSWPNEIREWTMLSPVNERRDLELRRGGQVVTVSIRTDPYPLRLPD
jgi:hypothetical protein